MFLLRNLLLTSLLLSTATQLSWAEKSEENSSSAEKKAVSDGSFEKRQGLAMEDDQLAMESEHHDQIAVESGHRDQMAVESNQHGQGQGPMPVPVPMRSIPGSIVFAAPPGFVQGQGPPPGHHGGPPPGFQGQGPPPGHHGLPMGLRAPPPPGKQGFHQGPQGQFSQQFQNHQAPPPNFLQGPHFIPPQQQQQFQQQNQNKLPQPSPTQIVHQQSTPSGGEIIIQKAQDLTQNGGNSGERQNQQGSQSQQVNSGEIVRNQIQQQQQQGNHQNQHPAGLVPPLPHAPRFQQQQQPPQKHGYSSAEITKNIIRELFDRKPPGLKDGRPNGGFFGPPPPGPGPQPGPSHPKVLNRPPNRPGRPGGIFTNGKEIALSTNDLNAEGGEVGPGIQYGGPGPFAGGNNLNSDGAWPAGPDGDTPKIVSLEVKCEKNVMRVFVAFDKPFFGVIFSKGHYHNVNCIHLPAGLGHTSANFDVGIDTCGTQGNTENGLYGYGVQSGSGSYFENTIVVQYDSQVQEVWDQARKLRCTWHDQYEKSVTFRPFPVDMLDVVRADFAGDNVGCWMQIQVGKGPWASEVSGLVKIGQTMTMVLAIKDDDNKFDMMVRNCLAHDGQRSPIQLVDQWGCITRPKLMSPFTKIKNFGASATVLSYAHFQAFKFPDSMEVHFQCTIQICRHQCPEQCSQPGGAGPGAGGYGVGKSGLPAPGDRDDSARRRRRSAAFNETSVDDDGVVFEYQTTFKTDFSEDDVGLNKVINVVGPEDLDFSNGGSNGESSSDEGVPIVESSADIVCMSTMGFAAMIVLLIGLLLVACIISAVIVIKKRPGRKSF